MFHLPLNRLSSCSRCHCGEVINTVLESHACFPSLPKTDLLGIKIFHYEPETFIRIPLNIYISTACWYTAKSQILCPAKPFHHISTTSLQLSKYLVGHKFSEVQVLDLSYKHKNKEKKKKTEKNSENLEKNKDFSAPCEKTLETLILLLAP